MRRRLITVSSISSQPAVQPPPLPAFAQHLAAWATGVYLLMDLVLLAFHQTHSFRLAEYFRQRHAFNVFPDSDFAKEAVEVGPHTNHDGPMLTLYRSVTVSPAAFLEWFQTSFLRRQVGRVYWLDQSVPPAQTKEQLIEAIIQAGVPAGATAIKIYATPRALEQQLAVALDPQGFALHPKAFSHVLQAVQLEEGLRWGYLPADQLWRKPWDEPRCFDSSVASAVMKIDEAMQLLGLAPAHQAWQWQEPPAFQPWHATPEEKQQHEQQQQEERATSEEQQQQDPNARLKQEQQKQQQQRQQQQQTWVQVPGLGISPLSSLPAGEKSLAWAIDIGAAPGAWSSYLATTTCEHVVAVDPAALNPAAEALPNLHHVRQRGEDAGAAVAELLGGSKADLLVCDINQHPNVTREIIKPMLAFLKPGGWLVVTLKFFGFGRDRVKAAASFGAFFEEELEPGHCVWLMANTTCERTYLAQRR